VEYAFACFPRDVLTSRCALRNRSCANLWRSPNTRIGRRDNDVDPQGYPQQRWITLCMPSGSVNALRKAKQCRAATRVVRSADKLSTFPLGFEGERVALLAVYTQRCRKAAPQRLQSRLVETQLFPAAATDRWTTSRRFSRRWCVSRASNRPRHRQSRSDLVCVVRDWLSTSYNRLGLAPIGVQARVSATCSRNAPI
jgi:hypothetical protein